MKRNPLSSRLFLTSVLLLLQMLLACSTLSSKQQTTVDEAIKALRKIEAATQVGATYQQYGSLVIEAQAAVNEARNVLEDGDLKTEMSATVEAYADAGSVWNNKIAYAGRFGEYLRPTLEPGATLIPKYGLKTDETSKVNPNEALQTIWAAAKAHLERASALAN